MSNLFDALDQSTAFNKFKVDDLLFVEYTCDPGGPKAEIWSHTNYFTYIVSGEMTLKTPEKTYQIKAGESYFIRKGAFIIPQFFEEVFCDMIIFIPDDFIRGVIDKHQLQLIPSSSHQIKNQILPLNLDETLIRYYQSLFSYFKTDKPPSEILLKLKFEELIINILTNTTNRDLINCLAEIHHNTKPSLTAIMEQNFNANLSLSEFARMTTRSLSTFRRDFEKAYQIPPGEWLRKKRLEFSRHLLKSTANNVDDIAYESGFSSRTHFIRCFKEQYGLSPHQYRLSKT